MGFEFHRHPCFQLLYSSAEVYTQKELCEKLKVTKQLVNSIIKSFWEQGYVILREAKDRRYKKIALTDKGREYAAKVLTPLQEAEAVAWDSLSAGELLNLVDAIEKYARTFESILASSKKI